MKQKTSEKNENTTKHKIKTTRTQQLNDNFGFQIDLK